MPTAREEEFSMTNIKDALLVGRALERGSEVQRRAQPWCRDARGCLAPPTWGSPPGPTFLVLCWKTNCAGWQTCPEHPHAARSSSLPGALEFFKMIKPFLNHIFSFFALMKDLFDALLSKKKAIKKLAKQKRRRMFPCRCHPRPLTDSD